MLPNVLHSRRASGVFPHQAHARGGHRRRAPRGGPSWDARRALCLMASRLRGAVPHALSAHRRRRGPVTQAPAPDTDRPRAAASCHAGGSRTRNLRPGAAPTPPAGRHTWQRPEKCAPDGVPSWVFAGRRKRPPVWGALFGLLGSTRPFTRGPRPLATPGQGWIGRRGGVDGMRL